MDFTALFEFQVFSFLSRQTFFHPPDKYSSILCVCVCVFFLKWRAVFFITPKFRKQLPWSRVMAYFHTLRNNNPSEEW